MAAVIGYLVSATLAVGAALLIAGPRHVVKRDAQLITGVALWRLVPTRDVLRTIA